MIHHLSLGTNDLKQAKAFYDAVFAVLGLRLLSQDDKIIKTISLFSQEEVKATWGWSIRQLISLK